MSGNPAGEIHVQLGVQGSQVVSARIDSSRPTDLGQRLFRGRSAQQVIKRLPLVFSVCVSAQSVAAAQAFEQAAGMRLDPAHVQARELLLLVEMAREHLFRIQVGWAQWLGEPPSVEGLALLGRMRQGWSPALYPQADAFEPGGGRLMPNQTQISRLRTELKQLTERLLGEPPTDWLSRTHLDGLGLGKALARRMLGRVLAEDLAGLGACSVAPLPLLDDASLVQCLAEDPAGRFVAAPDWQGKARETGALQRQSRQRLLAMSLKTHGNGLLSRQLARLCELAETVVRIEVLTAQLPEHAPAGLAPVAAEGTGISQIEAARGRLVHWLSLQQGRVVDYRILAPTEWNFHPEGVLVQGLKTLPADRDLAQLAQLLVDAIDPCVEARLSITEV